MPGTIDFQYDASKDIVIATPKWRIVTQEDCETWFHQWDSYLARYRRKVDCVVVLNDFHVDRRSLRPGANIAPSSISPTSATRSACRQTPW